MPFALNSINCGDTSILIQQIADATIDLIIADIPYFEIVDDDWDNQWESLDSYLTWLDGLFGQFARVLKQDRACYVYSSISYYPHVQLCLNKHLTYSATITWKKQRSRGDGWVSCRQSAGSTASKWVKDRGIIGFATSHRHDAFIDLHRLLGGVSDVLCRIHSRSHCSEKAM